MTNRATPILQQHRQQHISSYGVTGVVKQRTVSVVMGAVNRVVYLRVRRQVLARLEGWRTESR